MLARLAAAAAAIFAAGVAGVRVRLINPPVSELPPDRLVRLRGVVAPPLILEAAAGVDADADADRDAAAASRSRR